MLGTSYWLDLNLILSDYELGVLPCAGRASMRWACFHALIYVLCRMYIFPFVVRISILPVPQLIITSIARLIRPILV